MARIQPGTSKLFSFLIITFSVSFQPLYAQWTDVASSLGVTVGTVSKDGGVAWADFNNDGFLDLLANTNNTTQDTRLFFWNSGTSSFQDNTTTHAAALLANRTERSVMAGDIDNDGDIDFMRSSFGLIEVYRNDGAGASPAYSFTLIQSIVAASFTPNGINNEGLAWIDFDGDGDLDIFVENHQYGLDIFINNGTGTFTHTTPDTSSRGFPTGTGNAEGDYTVTADLDNNGHVDLIARRENTSSAIDEVDIWINNGDGTFTPNNDVNLEGDNSSKGGVAVADFDNDGDFDYAWTNNGPNLSSNTVEIVEQTGLNSLSFSLPTVTITSGDDGTLTALPVNQNIEGIAISDVNNDGKIDIFLARNTGPSYLLINNTSGQGDFNFIHDNSGVPTTSINPINVNADGEGLAFGDYDNDGDMDFYLNINSGNNQLWQNNIIASPTNFVKVVPKIDLGSGLTRPAIGATVTVSDGCDLFSGIQEVSGGIGHGSQNDSRLHFGLPNGPGQLYKIEVSFVRPNGGSRTVVTKYVTPSALTNQTLTVLDTDPSDANREPTAVDDNVSTDENTLVTIDVQANDSDPMGETLTTAILTSPSNGTAVLNGDDIDYTPDVGFFGTETFT
ncbi:MAG: FG-GAP-like repeat-containing protein [Cyclobacteriaceae bacterium]